MAIQYLKKGKNEADRAVDDVKVRGVVEDILKAIEERGDNAVRAVSYTHLTLPTILLV